MLGYEIGGGETAPLPYADGGVPRDLAHAQEALRSCTTSRGALAIEAKAASAYWSALASTPFRFAKADAGRIPEHWSSLGERHSILSSKPRLAISPGHAILNFLYHLAAAEASLALLALGLDPALGWAHRDAPYRDSAALDLVEAVRPDVDDYVIGLLAGRTFSRLEFVELPTGQVRLAPSLAKLLAESTLGRWEAAVTGHAEAITQLLAGAARGSVRAPKASTRGAGTKGRAALGRGSTGEAARGKRVPNACRMCGVILSIEERGHARKICDECLHAFEADRTEKLVKAPKTVLSEMRASPQDPAQSQEAQKKRSQKARGMSLAARAWEREHGLVVDPEFYARVVMPKIQSMSVRALVQLTGLSEYYLWRVRKGERRLHPRFWERVASKP